MRVVFVGRDRVIWKRLVLHIVTFGISRRIWLYRVNKEIDGHAALGINHKLNLALLILPVIGPFIVQCQTTARLNNDLHSGAQLKYGPTWAMCLPGLVWLFGGNLFYMGWTQDRLNKYWAYEKAHPNHGIDIDVGLNEDPKFLVAVEKARKESYQAGSRFDRAKRIRQERWRNRVEPLQTIGKERQAAREAGGSNPVLPWRAPKPLEMRSLSITCSCGHGFEQMTDWSETVTIECPSCHQKEMLRPLIGTVPAKLLAGQAKKPAPKPTKKTTSKPAAVKKSANKPAGKKPAGKKPAAKKAD